MHAFQTAALIASVSVAAAGVVFGQQPPPVLDKALTAGGHRLHYLEAGSGPPVVLLHGLGADVRVWRQVVPVLAATHHVYAIDLLGFGQSDKPDITYRVGAIADSVAAFVDAAHLERPAIVGHSLGGWVAAIYAIRYPDRLQKLVLIDAAGYGDEPGQIVRDYLSQYDPAAAAMAERMLAGMTPEQQIAAQALVASYFANRATRPDAKAMASLAQSLLRGEDLLGADIKKINVPTLIVWGRNDPIVPLSAGEAMAREIPGARRIVLDNCGHRPQSQCTAAFNAALKEFLDVRATDVARY